MKFKSIFDHPPRAPRRAAAAAGVGVGVGVGDFRSGTVYAFTPAMELALSAAAATQRPLLVTGPAGCGKSSLARSAAARLKWRYLERTVNSRTEITSLLWEVDQLHRLQDAQAKALNPELMAYVRPAVLWQALDLESAAAPLSLLREAPPKRAPKRNPAVVLIDEIDKADPDLPNNLLEVLGGLRFEVADTGRRVTCRSGIPLIVITSNDERDLPPAFVRRCISLNLKQPDLGAVARLHFPKDGKTIAAALKLLATLATTPGAAAAPAVSAAEFLDFVQACKELQVGPRSDSWMQLAEACVLKGRSATRSP